MTPPLTPGALPPSLTPIVERYRKIIVLTAEIAAKKARNEELKRELEAAKAELGEKYLELQPASRTAASVREKLERIAGRS